MASIAIKMNEIDNLQSIQSKHIQDLRNKLGSNPNNQLITELEERIEKLEQGTGIKSPRKNNSKVPTFLLDFIHKRKAKLAKKDKTSSLDKTDESSSNESEILNRILLKAERDNRGIYNSREVNIGSFKESSKGGRTETSDDKTEQLNEPVQVDKIEEFISDKSDGEEEKKVSEPEEASNIDIAPKFIQVKQELPENIKQQHDQDDDDDSITNPFMTDKEFNKPLAPLDVPQIDPSTFYKE